jgi:hypothetical protein
MTIFRLLLVLSMLGSLTLNAARADDAHNSARRCVLDSTTNKDRRAVMRWFFVSYATHSELRGMAPIPSDTVQDAVKAVSQFTERIMLSDCVKELKIVSERQGLNTAYALVISTFGALAANEFNANQEVRAAIAELGSQLPKEELQRVYGQPPATPSTNAPPSKPSQTEKPAGRKP